MSNPLLTLWINGQSNTLASGWQSQAQATLPSLKQGDDVGIEIHLIQTSKGLSYMDEVPFENGCTVKAAIGRNEQKPTTGYLIFGYEGDTVEVPFSTPLVSTSSAPVSVNSLINSLPSIAAAGGVIVSIVNGFTYRFVFNVAGVRSLITCDSTNLRPTSTVLSKRIINGSVSSKDVQHIKPKVIPVAYQDNFSDSPPPEIFISNPSPAITRVSISPSPKYGSFVVSNGTLTSGPIPITATADEFNTELESCGISDTAIPPVHSTYSVLKVGPFDWDISRTSGAAETITASDIGLIGFKSKFGHISLNNEEVEDLLAGASSASALLEIEITDSFGTQTAYQGAVTIINDLIDSQTFSPIELPRVIEDAPTDNVLYGRKNNAWSPVIGDGNNIPDYNNGLVYTVGNQVYYSGKLYRMIGAVGAAGYNPVAYPSYWETLSGGSSTWGNITGSISSQTDLSNALASKVTDAPSDNTPYLRQNGTWTSYAVPSLDDLGDVYIATDFSGVIQYIPRAGDILSYQTYQYGGSSNWVNQSIYYPDRSLASTQIITYGYWNETPDGGQTWYSGAYTLRLVPDNTKAQNVIFKLTTVTGPASPSVVVDLSSEFVNGGYPAYPLHTRITLSMEEGINGNLQDAVNYWTNWLTSNGYGYIQLDIAYGDTNGGQYPTANGLYGFEVLNKLNKNRRLPSDTLMVAGKLTDYILDEVPIIPTDSLTNNPALVYDGHNMVLARPWPTTIDINNAIYQSHFGTQFYYTVKFGNGGGNDTKAPINFANYNFNSTYAVSGDIWLDSNGALRWKDISGNIRTAAIAAAQANSTPIIISYTGTGTAFKVTSSGTAECMRVEDSTSPDSTPFVISASGRVGIGAEADATVALRVDTTGIKFGDGTIQTSAATTPNLSGYALLSGATFTGKVNTPSSTASNAGFNIGAGSAPTSPVSGDIWMQTAGNYLYYRAPAGVTYTLAMQQFTNTFSSPQIVDTTSNTLPALRVTQKGTADSFVVEDELNPDTSAFIVNADGKVGIGTPTGFNATGYRVIIQNNSGEAGLWVGGGINTNSGIAALGKISANPNNVDYPPFNLGTACASTPLGAANGDIWITNAAAPKLAYRTGGVNYYPTVANAFNTFTGGMAISGSSVSNPQLQVTQTGAGTAVQITTTGAGPALVVEDSTTPDTTSFVVDTNGNVGIGVASGYTATNKLEVVGAIKATSITFDGTKQYSVSNTQTNPFGSGNISHTEYPLEMLVSYNGSTYAMPMRLVSTP